MKKFLSLMLVLAMVLAVAVPALAADSDPELSYVKKIYMEGTKTRSVYQDALVLDYIDAEVKTADVTSSNKKVASISAVTNSTVVSYGVDCNDVDYRCATVDLTVKKPGKTTVTIKTAAATYKAKITVLAYVNPVKWVRISGVNGNKNLKSLTAKSSYAIVPDIKKNVSSTSTCVASAKGWKIAYVGLTDTDTGRKASRTYAEGSYPTYATVLTGALNKNDYYQLTVVFYNVANKAYETLYYTFK